MAATAEPSTATQAQKYEFVQDVWVDELGSSERVLIEKGAKFTAQLAEEWSRERILPNGRIIPPERLGQMYVVESDVPVSPGCLTSCIRTGRARTPEQIRDDAKREAAQKAAKKNAK